ncbi:hypothetical protein [Ectobacillus ponti]|uniref:Uncharacterized protein n=1 Tax=Ectobacillus ponti TaxID=2961894 RepID=A0AA41X8H4_9BACI|nr:hypothetical protein [Ectobacillus ponti]MCP8970727.1 hypothetical protein [Ectobacillus ponti]
MTETFEQHEEVLSNEEMEMLMKTVGDGCMHVLRTGQPVIIGLRDFELALMVGQNDFSMQSSLYPLAACVTPEGQLTEPTVPPLFAGRRHFLDVEDFEGYINEEELPSLWPKQSQAFFFTIHLLRTIQLGSI